jgi:hypothetical protein
MVQINKDISKLKTRLEHERIFLFSKMRYGDFFIKNGQSYELTAEKLSSLHFKEVLTIQEAMNSIKKMLQAYHQQPFWRRIWWLITRPIKLYQGLYELHSLSRLEYLSGNYAQEVVLEYYNNSLLKPNWFDRLFKTWRLKLYHLINLIEVTPPRSQPESWKEPPKEAPSSWKSPFIVALEEELGKETFSFKRIVDCYQYLDKRFLKEHEKKDLEKKIWLKIHPDKYFTCKKEIWEEATKQTQRFGKLREASEEVTNIVDNGYSDWLREYTLFQQWKQKCQDKELRKKEMDEFSARFDAKLKAFSEERKAEIEELKNLLKELMKNNAPSPSESSFNEPNSSPQFFKTAG